LVIALPDFINKIAGSGFRETLMIKRIHHINFIVKDLKKAVQRYRILFGEPVAESEVLPQRGVKLARFKVGEIWLILVQPVDTESVPAKFLQQHGEGFFLISCQVDDVKKAASMVASKGIEVLDKLPRQGLDDWAVMDLSPDELFGVDFQLMESARYGWDSVFHA
jgi:methylmalonyl-CoA/ethylmalonyl-CoA epimerase